MSQGLAGWGAVVTGGGRGIGAACAGALAEAGARVLLAARSKDQVEAVADALRAAGHDAHATTCDVSAEGDVARLASVAAKLLGDVDILVNNAGIAPSAPVRSETLEQWERTLAVNATGTFLCTRAFLPAMAARGRGRVVNIASISSKVGAPYIASYAASKHAVLGFTRSVALEVAAAGVTVNAICPGYVDTPMTDLALARMGEKTGRSPEELRQHLRSQSPQGRIITVEEVAFLALTLCDERARGINGQAIVIDGGGVQG